jgi:predicted nucleotidyltransferase
MHSVEKLKEYLENDLNVVFAVVFGSGASQRQRKDSDIDIGIYFKRPPEGMELLHLITVLSGLAGKDVDVAVLNKASVFLRHQAMKYRVSLTVKDESIYRKFREKTISDYEEYKYISQLNV